MKLLGFVYTLLDEDDWFSFFVPIESMACSAQDYAKGRFYGVVSITPIYE